LNKELEKAYLTTTFFRISYMNKNLYILVYIVQQGTINKKMSIYVPYFFIVIPKFHNPNIIRNDVLFLYTK